MVGTAVGVAVGVFEGVEVGASLVGVGVFEEMIVTVGVGVTVFIGTLVGTAVGVAVGVFEGVTVIVVFEINSYAPISTTLLYIGLISPELAGSPLSIAGEDDNK